ncbi:protein DpdF [Kribbella sp. NPDC051718]|uniref:protein DpdF n=1 Tax=Kribbella sp. NPDC051718 TaxID=3155168 RepID=UPI003420CEC6
MTDEFDLVQRALLGGPIDPSVLTGPYRRLADAWASDVDGRAISGDLAALVGQILRHQCATTGHSRHYLEVPLDARGVDPEVFRVSNLGVARFGGSNHRVILGRLWQPGWLHGDMHWIDVACASPGKLTQATGNPVSTNARPDRPIPVDPALHAIAPAIKEYRSRTQATAVRTAALADPASTVHVVLPTGTGKSVVGLAPGLLQQSGTTVFVVPTIALALDQERQLHARFPKAGLPAELAYYGDRSAEEKGAIRERLRAGTQRVLFSSPEAIVESLSTALQALVAMGGLTHFVIDEAHLIRSWGLSFRPQFQMLAALLAELRGIASAAGHPAPRVALLTATLSEQGLRLNDALFGGPAESLFVGSTFLRTELRYLLGETTTADQRLDRLVEALHHLPRPAIVYTTRKEQAVTITQRLRQAGFNRTEVFHGDVNSLERLEILKKWSGDGVPTSCDVVVGTSAFGLGVDQADVRTVVHACIPASVDRFYQEVGRAGRDGHAAVSVWLPAAQDRADGQRIERATMIGHEKAWKRWESMRLRSPATGPAGLIVVDTEVVPAHNEQPSDSNRLWNRNTLILMQRAGLIDMERTQAPRLNRDPNETQGSWDARVEVAWQAFRSHVAVLVRGNVNLSEAGFEQALAAVRAEIKSSEAASSRRIDRLLARSECWGTILSEEYVYSDVGSMKASQSVGSACSGCPATGHRLDPTYSAARPLVTDASMTMLHRRVSPTLAGLTTHHSIVVTYPDERLRTVLATIVQSCVTHGIRSIVASRSLVNARAIASAARFSDEGLIIVDTVPQDAQPLRFAVPTLIVLDRGDIPQVSWLAPSAGPLRVVLLPQSTPDPVYPEQLVKNVRSPHLGADDFLRRV